MAEAWSVAEDERLRQLYTDPNVPITRIATMLGRTRDAVNKRASQQGLRRPADAPHCESEV